MVSLLQLRERGREEEEGKVGSRHPHCCSFSQFVKDVRPPWPRDVDSPGGGGDSRICAMVMAMARSGGRGEKEMEGGVSDAGCGEEGRRVAQV
jgi:hypothetical protein